MTYRSGSTLIELVTTLALIAITTTVVTVAVRRFTAVSPLEPPQMLADSMRAAVASQRMISLSVVENNTRWFATAWPDGSIVADSIFHHDRLKGARQRER